MLQATLDINSEYMQPKSMSFLKWMGNKKKLAPMIVSFMPKNWNTYHEPFVGSAAVFFELKPKSAVLSDLNPYLIRTYKAVRSKPDIVEQHLNDHIKHDSPEFYASILKNINSRIQNGGWMFLDSARDAADFIYIVNTAIYSRMKIQKNGNILAYNKCGLYKGCVPNLLKNCALALVGVDLLIADFEKLNVRRINSTQLPDLYYLDPPYEESRSDYIHGETDFLERLLFFCKKIDNSGSYFILSNHMTPKIQKVFSDFYIKKINSNNMRNREDCLIFNYRP